MRIEFGDDFHDVLAEIIPDAIRRLQFLEHGIQFFLLRDHARYLLSDHEGMLLTEPGFFSVPACLIWFELDHDETGASVLRLLDAVATPPLDETEDFS